MYDYIEGEVYEVLWSLLTVVEENHLTYYQVVERMSPEMREELASALYAYSANQDALTDNVHI